MPESITQVAVVSSNAGNTLCAARLLRENETMPREGESFRFEELGCSLRIERCDRGVAYAFTSTKNVVTLLNEHGWSAPSEVAA